jgi:hypothetical protein
MGGNPQQKDGAVESLRASQLAPLFWRPVRLGLVSAWWEHVPFAHWIVSAMRPKSVVELGTHNGVSYSAFCEAVARLSLDAQCHAIDTWKGDEQAGMYGEQVYADLKTFHDSRYGSFSTLLRATFDEAAAFFATGSIDLLHIDGLHSYQAVQHDFETWLPKMSASGVILFHDINVRGGDFGVWRLWEELRTRFPSFTFIHGHGLGVLAVGPTPSEAITQLCAVGELAHINAIRERFALVGERWNLEYRDAERVRHLSVRDQEMVSLERANSNLQEQIRHQNEHAALLQAAVEEVKQSHRKRDELIVQKDDELAMLRTRLAELETARSTLHDGLQDQLRRAEALSFRLGEMSAERAEYLAASERLRAESASAQKSAAAEAEVAVPDSNVPADHGETSESKGGLHVLDQDKDRQKYEGKT